MKNTVLGAVLTCCLLLGAGCQKKPPPAPPRDPCLDNCLLRAKELACKHPEKCEPTCQKVAKASACKKPLDAFMTCALAQKTKEWECSGEGIPVMFGEHSCEEERAGMLDCLQQSKGKL